MSFVDECVVYAKAGRGGGGSAHLHSEPYKSHGGPDGGDGGDGGSIIFDVSSGVRDLAWLSEHPHQRAHNGEPGRSTNRAGATGKDTVVTVPDGTVVFDDGGLLADLVGAGARAVVARGGRGGRGNAALASARNRVPRTAEPGEAGDEKRLRVELRTVADIGLVGLPNAGKSTLLSRITAATPKIANYPFTTLTPNLGVAGRDDERFVVADIPGLVEGAHEGRGLGHRFLRHIVRCRALVLVVDLSARDPSADLATLRHELSAYDPALTGRPALVVGAKLDLVGDGVDAAAALDPAALAVSAVTGAGLDELLGHVASLTQEAKALQPEVVPYVVLRPGRPRFTVTQDGRRWRVSGQNVERWMLETDMEDEDQVERLQRRLVKEGVERKLTSLGARRGDEVTILGHVFEFIPEPEGRKPQRVDEEAREEEPREEEA